MLFVGSRSLGKDKWHYDVPRGWPRVMAPTMKNDCLEVSKNTLAVWRMELLELRNFHVRFLHDPARSAPFHDFTVAEYGDIRAWNRDRS